ncbi:MAG TPA: cytochrome C oxidase subunit IV family protein [Thermomicrobiales bacterium]|nr:cytochrome C oxidase subunit IV family protein [Thermomicrobiales bacterium]
MASYRDSVMNSGPGTKPGTDHEVDAHHEHPSERTYIRIAIILAIITLIEVVIYYIEALSGVLVPMLVVLSAAKFVTVVGYFMHLKFDDRRLGWIFTGGLLVAFSVFIGLFVMQYFHQVVEFVGDIGRQI